MDDRDLQAQLESLRRRNERLEAELERVLQAAPCATSVAAAVLNLVDDLLEGEAPTAQQLITIREQVRTSRVMWGAYDLKAAIRAECQDADVAENLIALLATRDAETKTETAVTTLGEIATARSSRRASLDLVRVSSSLPLTDHTEAILRTASQWQWNAFDLRDATGDKPLSCLAFWVFQHAGLVDHFSLQVGPLCAFLRRVEQGYADHPYHNRTHVADVLQTVFKCLTSGGMPVTKEDMLVCFLAAIVHDFEHTGLTNDFLVATEHPLAIVYNDYSPHENHHASAAWKLVTRPEYDFLPDKSRRAVIRHAMIELVLATDMRNHFTILNQFTNRFNLIEDYGGRSSTSPNQPDYRASLLPDLDEKKLLLQVLLKASDLSHLSATHAVHVRWVTLLEREFFAQGDLEKQLGLEVTPLFDRAKGGVTKSQVSFFDIVGAPLFAALTAVAQDTSPLLTAVMANRNAWAGHPRTDP